MSKQLSEAAFHLLKARDVIEKHGWCRGAMISHGGRHCMMGALFVAGRGWGEDRVTKEVSDRALTMLVSELESRGANWPGELKGEAVMAFNDTLCKSKHMAMDVFAKAALR